jgi:hypothetical protein
MTGMAARSLAAAVVTLACCCAQSDSADAPHTGTPPTSESRQTEDLTFLNVEREAHAQTLPALLELMAEHHGATSKCPLPRSAFEENPCKLWAIQQMLTTTSASDGAVGGAFRTAYFWHWIDPNPRLSIVKIPEDVPLGELPPPEGFQQYQSYAYVDRTPAIYFSDLAADEPRYSHHSVGEFTTFGWCSEREMALCALLTTWGFSAKVHQTGIHVTTRVWLVGQQRPMELILDTTFNYARLAELAQTDFATWSNDFGQGADVSYYNRVCHDGEVQEQLRNIHVSAAARRRLTGQAESYFNDR